MALSVDEVDLPSLVLARNDTHPDVDWWFDPQTGRCHHLAVDDDDHDLSPPASGAHVVVPRDPQPASEVEAFFASPEAAGLGEDVLARLAAARRGRGGPRRFREVVPRTPAAGPWSAFTLRRETIRAIDWLLERGLVEEASARRRRVELAGGDVEWGH